MPGFGNNTQGVQGGAVTAVSTGSVRFRLEPFTDVGLINPRQNNGTPILVSGSSKSIHVASLTALDEVYLWASNKGTADSELTLSVVTSSGGSTAEALVGQQRIVTTLKSKGGLQLVYPGIPHTNNDRIVAASSNDNISVCGFVMRRFRETATDPNQGFDGQE